MPRAQAEAVLGHEINHIASGDMVTLALLQGALVTFVIFLARIIGDVVDRTLIKNARADSRLGFFRDHLGGAVCVSHPPIERIAVPQSATFSFGQPTKHFFEE